MAKRQDEKALAEQARFIFQGTVEETDASTMPATVPATDKTAIVRVDKVIQAPQALAAFVGQAITVQLSGRATLKPGQEATFYTNGWRFGESVAVQSVGQFPVSKVAAAAASLPGEPARAMVGRDLQERLASADVVVSGRVSGIRLPEGEAAAPMTRSLASAAPGGPPADTGRISEHDPLWQEAVIDVEDVLKGSHGARTVVVRFPSSTDVRWHKAPKFQPGQQGVFILNKEQVQAPPTATRGLADEAAAPEVAYTAVGPLDYLPPQQLEDVKTLVAASENA